MAFATAAARGSLRSVSPRLVSAASRIVPISTSSPAIPWCKGKASILVFYRASNRATLGTRRLLTGDLMGWDATFYFPSGIKRNDAEHFLVLIGYKRLPVDSISRKIKSTSFYFPPDSDPARLSSVTAEIYVNDDGKLVATSRANIWCTYRDTELQNMMLRELKNYFKGYFESDFGKNRYFKNSGPNRHGVEAACYAASFRFLNSIVSMKFLNTWVMEKTEPKPKREKDFAAINMTNPAVLTANLGTIYVVSLVEEFFKSIFIETLRSSKHTINLNRFGAVRPFVLERAYQGQISLENAVAENLSFQNADRIRQHFSGLPLVGSIAKYLGRTFSSRSQIKRVDMLQRIFDKRHSIVHQAEIDYNYLPSDLMKDISFCERLVRGLYRGLTTENKWPYVDPR
jgi:hypothetical protein